MTFVTSAIGNDTRTMTIDHDIIALSGSYASPTPTSSDSGFEPAITGGVQFALAFLIPMLFILGPALILGVKIGMPGFMGGLMVGFGVWSLINPIAIAILVAVIFASIIMLMYGRGKATGE